MDKPSIQRAYLTYPHKVENSLSSTSQQFQHVVTAQLLHWSSPKKKETGETNAQTISNDAIRKPIRTHSLPTG